MGKRKLAPMSMQEHRELAAKLRRFENDAYELYNGLARTNLFTVAKLKCIERVMASSGLSYVKSELENYAFREHPDEASIHLYCGDGNHPDGSPA